MLTLGIATTVALSNDVAKEDTTEGSSGYSGLAGVDLGDPDRPVFIKGRRVTLEEAARVFGRPMYRPQHPLASDASIEEVWIGTLGQPEVGIKYVNDIRVYLTLWPENAPWRPRTNYRSEVAQSTHATYVEIGGHPGLVVPEGAQVPNADGIVSFAVERVEVSLYGYHGSEQLVEIAETVI